MMMDFEMDARSEDRPVQTRRVGATVQAGSTAILNGFGRSLGDSIIGLQALTLALEAGTIAPAPVLLRLPGLPTITRQLYDVARHIGSVETLPSAHAKPGPPPGAASGFDRVIDLRDFAFDPVRCMPIPIHGAAMAWLCGLVASVGLIVSTDTAMVHLAAAFSVPCLAFFTTHRPEWRVRDYPLCRAVHLPAALPPALELARGDDDRKAALAAWFPDGPNLSWLERALGDCVQFRNRAPHDRQEF